MRASVRSAATLVALFLSTLAFGQSGVTVELDDVTDNRVSAGGFVGSLEMRVKLSGSPLEKAEAARIVVKEARDDRSNVLTKEDDSPDYTSREYNSGTLQFSLDLRRAPPAP